MHVEVTAPTAPVATPFDAVIITPARLVTVGVRPVAQRRHILMAVIAVAVLVPFVALHIVLCVSGTHSGGVHAASQPAASGPVELVAGNDCRHEQPHEMHVPDEPVHALPRTEGPRDALAVLGALTVTAPASSTARSTWRTRIYGRGSRWQTGRRRLIDLCIARS